MASKTKKLSLRSQAAKELSKSKTKSIDFDYDVVEEEPKNPSIDLQKSPKTILPKSPKKKAKKVNKSPKLSSPSPKLDLSKTPGLSKILRKANAKYIETQEIHDLQMKLTYQENLNAMMINAILNNPNVCVYPNDLQMIVQSASSYTNYIPLNESFSPEGYREFLEYNMGSIDGDDYTRDLFIEDLNIFENVWYGDNGLFQKQCKKDIVIFPVTVSFYRYNQGFLPGFGGRHACILVVDKKNKKGYFLDPQDDKKETLIKHEEHTPYNLKKMYEYLCYKSEAWIYKLLGLKIIVDTLDLEAPQSITNDSNCLFWAMMLTDVIIRYYDTKGIIDPKKVINLIKKRYNTKEKLDTLIRRYTAYINKIKVENFPEELSPPPLPKKKSAWDKIKNYFSWF
jgi:hypothetical protein